MSSTRPHRPGSRARRRLGLVAGLGVATALLSSCGGLQPGVAIVVGDTDITTSEVEDLALDVCALQEAAPSSGTDQPSVVSGADVQSSALQALALRSIADQMGEEYGVTVGDDFEAQERQARLQFGGVDDQSVVDAALPAYTSVAYFVDIIRQVGEQELGGNPTDDEALAEGIQQAQRWQAENGVETSPAFDGFSIGDDQIVSERTDLSVVAGATAKEAAAGSPEFLAGLPSSQRCG